MNDILKSMGTFYSKCRENEIDLDKDENYPQIEDLPNEIVVGIFSYLDKNEIMEVAMVNKRWFQVANSEIDNLLIKWPKQQNQDFENLINRFPRLKNIELATRITNKDSYILSFLDSLEFDGTLEFDIDPNLIPAKNWDVFPRQPFSSYHSTSITRIRINSPKEKIIGYKKSQIISFAVEMPNPKDFDSVLEEILSLDNVSKIRYSAFLLEGYYDQQEYINFVKIIESIFSRPCLKQIDFDVVLNVDLNTVAVFPKNYNVVEVNFNTGLKPEFSKKVFDALSNLKKVKVFADLKSLPSILKNISFLTYLKSLNASINSRHGDDKIDEQKLRDCCNIIKDSFPMNSEVCIGDMDYDYDILTYMIIKEEGKEPENVIGKNLFVFVD